MKRKLSVLALGLILALVIVSCDGGYTDFMKSMGKNVMGNDESQVSTAVTSVEVSAENKTESSKLEESKTYGKEGSTVTINEGQTIKYKNSEGKETELFTVGKTNEGTQVIAVGDFALTLSDKVTTDVSSITAVLPPQDLSSVVETLESSGKDALLVELSKPITDETTKEAAQGTATLVKGLMEMTAGSMSDGTDEEVKKIVENVNKGLESNNLTMGDVVVLQAVTNIITASGNTVLETVDKLDKNEGDSVDAKTVLGDVYDDAMDTVFVLNNVSDSTSAFKGIDLTNIVNKFMK